MRARGATARPEPTDVDRSWVHERYVGELLNGEFRESTRQQFVSLVGRLRDSERIDGVVLAGTELPLLMSAPAVADVPVLDTTALHVAAIVERLREAETLPPETPSSVTP